MVTGLQVCTLDFTHTATHKSADWAVGTVIALCRCCVQVLLGTALVIGGTILAAGWWWNRRKRLLKGKL